MRLQYYRCTKCNKQKHNIRTCLEEKAKFLKKNKKIVALYNII